MSDKAVNIQITADGRQAERGLQQTAQALEQVGTSAQQAGQAQKGAGAAAQEMGQKAQAGAQQAAQGAGLVQQSTHKVRDVVQSISTQLDTARQQLLGFLGIQLGAQAAKDVIGLADAYKNLQSRISLVTGDGELLGKTMNDVQAVALRTHSALENTGVLFTRIAQAGRDAGLSLEQATAQSLALTETINQTLSISGASAAASDAAITQLIQGLQSGVLRGEEFNSVMEQAPRLARALADGLGVTTGELRKLAESGALTTDVVVKSLQSQGQAIEQEFGKMPLTVGKAITDVQTAFMRYIADVDAAHGVTEGIAAAVQLVGQNLDTLGDALAIAGKGWLAFKGYNMAQTWLEKSKAILAAKLAVQEETQATATNTQAKAANTAAHKAQAAAIGASTAAQQASAAATTAATTAQVAAAGRVGLFSRAITGTAAAARGLMGVLGGPVGLAITVATFSGEIKRGIGAVVEWGMGFTEAGKRMKATEQQLRDLAMQEKVQAELRRQEAQAQAAREAKTQLTIAAQYDLSKAAQAATASFAKLTAEGKTAAEAVKSITANFDTTQQQGLRDFATTLNKLAADGQLTADQLKTAWGQVLSGQDLQVFKLNAQQAFSGLAQEAQLNAQLAEAVLAQALQRTGLNLQVLKGGMGEAAASAINDVQTIANSLDTLAQQGVDTGVALTASLGKAIDTADSQKAIEAIRGQVEQLRATLGDKVADGLLQQAEQKARDLKKALEDSTPGIQSTQEAMRRLGITSDESLRNTAKEAKEAYSAVRTSGTASAREVSEAFRVAAQAAIAAADGQVPAWVRAQAAAQGYKINIDQAGNAVLELINKTNAATDSAHNLRSAWHGVAQAVASVPPPPKLGTNGEPVPDQVSAAKGGGSFSALAYQQNAKDVHELDAWWEEWSADYNRKNAKYGGTSLSLNRYWFEVQKAQYQNARRDLEMQQRIAQKAEARRGAAGGTVTQQPIPPQVAQNAGNTYVSNIILPGGGTQQIQFTDANSQRATEELLRQLAAARGSAAL